MEDVRDNEIQDEEKLIEEFIEQKQKVKYMESMRPNLDNFIPSTPVESAKSLLDKSETTREIKQVDKEHKLANLKKSDKDAVFYHTELWDFMQMIKEKQLKKELEASIKFGLRTDITKEEFEKGEISDIQLQKILTQEMKNRNLVQRQDHQDESGAFNKAFFISALSKGVGGWERNNQNTTISHHTIGKTDKSEEKPNVLSRMTGRK